MFFTSLYIQYKQTNNDQEIMKFQISKHPSESCLNNQGDHRFTKNNSIFMILGFLLSPSSLHYVQGDLRELDWTIKIRKKNNLFMNNELKLLAKLGTIITMKLNCWKKKYIPKELAILQKEV